MALSDGTKSIKLKQKQIAQLLITHCAEPSIQALELCLDAGWRRMTLQLLKLRSSLIPVAILSCVKRNNVRMLSAIVEGFKQFKLNHAMLKKINVYTQPGCAQILQNNGLL